MGILQRKVCCGNTCGDYFKLTVPVGWTVTSFCATMAYLLAPLARNGDPRWGTAALVSLSFFSGIGSSSAVYNFHRTASYELTTDENTLQERKKKLYYHFGISSLFIIVSAVLIIFFAFVAPDFDLCAHETCGADVSWSAISLVVSIVWFACSNPNGLGTAKQNSPDVNSMSSIHDRL
jgi:hypothetical protein